MEFIPWEKLNDEQIAAVNKKWPSKKEPEDGPWRVDFEYDFTESGAAFTRRLRAGAPEEIGGVALDESRSVGSAEKIIRVPRASIVPSPLNPRKTFHQEYLGELAATIRANGIINALIVRPRNGVGVLAGALYELVAGECRWRAAEIAELAEVPVVVRELSDVVVLELMLAENMKRKDLTPLEEMDAFSRMLEQKNDAGEPVYNQTSLAAKIGVSLSYLHQRLSLVKLTAVGREALLQERISFKTARTICQCPPSVIPQVEDEVLHPKKYQQWRGSAEPLTAEETSEAIQERHVRELSGCPFELPDAQLVPVHEDAAGQRLDGGACADCPWNTANQGPAREEGKPGKAGRPSKACLNPSCFAKKVEIHVATRLAKAKENGSKILSDKEAGKIFAYQGQLTYNSPYVKLSDKLGASDRAQGISDKKAPTWKKVVAGDVAPPIVVAVDDRGHVYELVERKLAIAAAQENGNDKFLSLGSGRGRSLQDEDHAATAKKEREKARERGKVSSAVLAELVAAVEDQGIDADSFSALSRLAVRHGGNAGCLLFLKRREIERGSTATAKVEEVLAGASGSVLLGMIVELLVAQDWSWHQGPNGGDDVVPKSAAPLLEVFGVDVKAVERRVKEEAKAAKKPGKKEARKGTQEEKSASDSSKSLAICGHCDYYVYNKEELGDPISEGIYACPSCEHEIRLATSDLKITVEEIEKLMPWCAEQKRMLSEQPAKKGFQDVLNVPFIQRNLGLSYAAACDVADRFVDWEAEQFAGQQLASGAVQVSGKKATAKTAKKGGAK